MSNKVIAATPTEEDFDPFGGCLDAQHAWKEFGGLSLDQAYEKFISHPLLYQEDFMFMGGRAFQFYFLVLDRYLRDYRVHVGPGDSEDSFAAIIAGGICTQLLSPTRVALNKILESIRELSGYVRSNLNLLAADSGEQQRIDSYWQILDAQMNSRTTNLNIMNTPHRDPFLRRDFLRVGSLAGIGLGLSEYLALAESGAVNGNAKAKAAIFVRLGGGPSHMDTFDLKPGAPDTHRGEFKEIATNVPGIRICEHLPKLAQCADKYIILRGVSHNLAAHELGAQYLGTGNRPLPALRYPNYGAVISKELKAAMEIPPFVSIPGEKEDATGYLGVEFGPFETGTTPQARRSMEIRGLSLGKGVTLADVDRRQDMLQRYDQAFGDFAQKDKLLAGMEQFSQRAYAMMRSERTRDAFDVARESGSISGLFGTEPFSQSCLLATRLVEAGVRFVTVNLTGWDTHTDNFGQLKNRLLPTLDAGLSGLFLALHEKGLLASTSVFVTGEFGRTPIINARGGRDHWPRAMCCLFAGGGIAGGRVIGESDAKGEGPKDKGITPDDVAATFYQSLGIDPHKEYHTPTGRPIQIVRNGTAIREVLGS